MNFLQLLILVLAGLCEIAFLASIGSKMQIKMSMKSIEIDWQHKKRCD